MLSFRKECILYTFYYSHFRFDDDELTTFLSYRSTTANVNSRHTNKKQYSAEQCTTQIFAVIFELSDVWVHVAI